MPAGYFYVQEVKLSDLPRDNLVRTLQYIVSVMQTIQQKYTELRKLSGSVDSAVEEERTRVESKAKLLEKEIAQQKAAIEAKQNAAIMSACDYPVLLRQEILP